MKLRYSKIWLAAIIFFLISTPAFSDKSYNISRVDIKAKLSADGKMFVTESRTYRFKGKYSFAYRTFPKLKEITFTDIKIIENEIPYRVSDTEEPGTYKIIKDKNQTEVRWFYRAVNESRIFKIEYCAEDAVICYKDAAVLHYQFISNEWNKTSSNVTLELEPPFYLSKNEVKCWPHGPLWMNAEILENGTIRARCKKVPKNSYFEIRALYPPKQFPDAVKKSIYRKEEIMKTEAKLADEANLRREQFIKKEQEREMRWAQGKWIMVALSLAGFLGWIGLFMKYGKRPPVQYHVPKFSPNIPEDIPPALVDYLIHGREIYGGGLMGTLFDLAGKGIIALRCEEKEKRGLLGSLSKKSVQYWDLKRNILEKKSSELSGYEKDLINFIFEKIGKGADSVDLKKIKKESGAFMKFFRKWKKDVKETGKKRKWFSEQSIKGMKYSLILTVLMILLAIPGFILYGPWGMVMMFSSIIVMILSFFITHRTGEGERLLKQWKALRRYLIKYRFRTADQNQVLTNIDRYFIYGTALGLTPKIYKELAGMIPAGNHTAYIPWFIYHSSVSDGFSASAFASTFSASIAATSSAMSSAAGAGGGAVAGGGGASSGGGGAG